MSDTFSLDIMKYFTEDISMTILVLSQRIKFSDEDIRDLQVQNIINEILLEREFFHNSDLFSLHINLNLDDNVYEIEILLKKELDIEIREKIYNEFEPVNVTNTSKTIKNENFSK